MNLVEQIFEQAKAGSANGQGFGQFFAEGVSAGQKQQSLNMQKQQLAVELAQAPLNMKLKEQDAAMNQAKLQSFLNDREIEAQAGLAFAKLQEEVGPLMQAGKIDQAQERIIGESNGWLLADPKKRLHSLFEMTTKAQDSKLEIARARAASMAHADFMPTEVLVESSIPGFPPTRVLRTGPNTAKELADTKPVTPSTTEKNFSMMDKLQSDLIAAQSTGDTAKIADAKRRLDTFSGLATPPSETITFDPVNGLSIVKGKTGSDITVATKTGLESALQSATTSIDVANRLEPLISSETVGVRAFAGSVVKDKLLAQFFPGVASQNRATAEVLSAQLRASTIKQLKSDGNISEKERQQILQAVPGINAPADSAEHAKDLIHSARKVAAIQAIVSASKLKAPVPSSAALALPWEEIVRLAKTGVLTPEQATAAYDAQLKARSNQ